MPKFILCYFLFLLNIYSQDLNFDNSYVLIKEIGEVEIRSYKPQLCASYGDNDNKQNQNNYFQILAKYIFGDNDKNERIAMTSPVVIQLFNKNKMLFIMPEKYDKKSIPIPNNNKIKIITTNYKQKAIIKYSGYSNKEKEKKKIEELKNILNKNGISYNNTFELLVYDPPYKLFNRRNEIAVDITKL